MTVDAAHAPAWPALQIPGADALGKILADRAVRRRHAHVRNLLEVLVERDILHHIGPVHVPVNAGAAAGARNRSADVEPQRRHGLRVRLIVRKFVHDFDDITDEAVGPMALLARGVHVGPCRVRRRENRPRITDW